MMLLTLLYKRGVKSCNYCVHLEKLKKSVKYAKNIRLPKCDKYTVMRNQIRCIDYELDLS